MDDQHCFVAADSYEVAWLMAALDRCGGGRHLLVEWKRASKPPKYLLSPMAVRCASKGDMPELQPLPLPPAAPAIASATIRARPAVQHSGVNADVSD